MLYLTFCSSLRQHSLKELFILTPSSSFPPVSFQLLRGKFPPINSTPCVLVKVILAFHSANLMVISQCPSYLTHQQHLAVQIPLFLLKYCLHKSPGLCMLLVFLFHDWLSCLLCWLPFISPTSWHWRHPGLSLCTSSIFLHTQPLGNLIQIHGFKLSLNEMMATPNLYLLWTLKHVIDMSYPIKPFSDSSLPER